MAADLIVRTIRMHPKEDATQIFATTLVKHGNITLPIGSLGLNITQVLMQSLFPTKALIFKAKVNVINQDSSLSSVEMEATTTNFKEETVGKEDLGHIPINLADSGLIKIQTRTTIIIQLLQITTLKTMEYSMMISKTQQLPHH